MHPISWLSRHDQGLFAFRRALRAAFVLPAVFAFGDKVLGNPTLAIFAAFGMFAMMLFVDFTGPMRERLQSLLGVGVVGGIFICLGTLASRDAYLAAACMVVVGFGVLFVGVISSILATATTALLLAFVLPVTSAGPPSVIPDRVEGWGLATAAALLANWLLWPPPPRNPLRAPTAVACRVLAERLRTDVAWWRGGEGSPTDADHEQAANAAVEGVAALQRIFLATPYRPTGLNLATRAVVRLVDELNWLIIVVEGGASRRQFQVNDHTCAVKLSSAEVLERAAALLEDSSRPVEALEEALTELAEARARLERGATSELPLPRVFVTAGGVALEEPAMEVITALEPGFRAAELSFATALIGGNVDLMVAADRRTWRDRLLGREPTGAGRSLTAAQERVLAHVDRNSVWLHNSLRGAIGLGIAVLVADLSGVQHGFWVVLGTLSVLRSNALNTGQNVLRSLIGTVVGFVIGALVLAAIGTNFTVLWFLLPIVVLLAGFAPAAISFAAGQAAFTLTVVILFNIIDPEGWRVGLLRIEDVAIGCAVSLVVGVLFWPRGAGAALSRALSDAYVESATYLRSAVTFGMARCDLSVPPVAPPNTQALEAAAAGRRLDDAFRSWLAERGAKPLPLAQVTSLVTGVVGIRLAGDAVLALWQADDGQAVGYRESARLELLGKAKDIQDWYNELAHCVLTGADLRDPVGADAESDRRLIDAVRNDFRGDDGTATETAVRMIWTADHLDASRRFQARLAEPARAAGQVRANDPEGTNGPAAWIRSLRAETG